MVRRGADSAAALTALPAKALDKGVDLSDALSLFVGREAEYQTSWDRSLAYLVVDEVTFAHAFAVTAELLGRI